MEDKSRIRNLQKMVELIEEAKQKKLWFYAEHGNKSWSPPTEFEKLVKYGAYFVPDMFTLKDPHILIDEINSIHKRKVDDIIKRIEEGF